MTQNARLRIIQLSARWASGFTLATWALCSHRTMAAQVLILEAIYPGMATMTPGSEKS